MQAVRDLDNQVGHVFTGLIVGTGTGVVTTVVAEGVLGAYSLTLIAAGASFGSVVVIGALWGAVIGFFVGCILSIAEMPKDQRDALINRIVVEIIITIFIKTILDGIFRR
jgi:hypothetical protein